LLCIKPLKNPIQFYDNQINERLPASPTHEMAHNYAKVFENVSGIPLESYNPVISKQTRKKR